MIMEARRSDIEEISATLDVTDTNGQSAGDCPRRRLIAAVFSPEITLPPSRVQGAKTSLSLVEGDTLAILESRAICQSSAMATIRHGGAKGVRDYDRATAELRGTRRRRFRRAWSYAPRSSAG